MRPFISPFHVFVNSPFILQTRNWEFEKSRNWENREIGKSRNRGNPEIGKSKNREIKKAKTPKHERGNTKTLKRKMNSRFCVFAFSISRFPDFSISWFPFLDFWISPKGETSTIHMSLSYNILISYVFARHFMLNWLNKYSNHSESLPIFSSLLWWCESFAKYLPHANNDLICWCKSFYDVFQKWKRILVRPYHTCEHDQLCVFPPIFTSVDVHFQFLHNYILIF